MQIRRILLRLSREHLIHNKTESQITRHLVFAPTARSLWFIFGASGSSHNGCAAIDISEPSQLDVCQWIRSRAVAKSADLENRFYTDGRATVQTVALSRALFKWKKLPLV
jgi:hypothetical protein